MLNAETETSVLRNEMFKKSKGKAKKNKGQTKANQGQPIKDTEKLVKPRYS